MFEEIEKANEIERVRARINDEQRVAAGYAGNAHLGKAAEPRRDYDQCAGSVRAYQALAERFTLENIEDAMHYQPWMPDQQDAGTIVREALTAAAKAILRSVPDSPFRTVALRNIIDARMNSNAAISFRGRF